MPDNPAGHSQKSATDILVDMPSTPLTDQLATRVRALLRGAAHPSGAAGTTASWNAERDSWLDALDPRDAVELDATQVRELIDFLSECGPSRSSRRSPAEWSATVDALVPELLFLTR
jgi:hypothetical protein